MEENTIQVIAYDCETGYAIIDDGNTIPCDKIVTDNGREVIHLPSNSTCRQWIDKKRADDAIAENGSLTLAYKARIVVGATGPKMPNKSLVEKYLSDEDLATYKEIIDRALAAKAADKPRPLTEIEKAQRAIERLNAKLAKLQGNNDTDEGGNN